MENKQPSRLRRWLKRSAFTLAVLITLFAAVVVFENWRGHRAWQKYRAEQEAKGEVFDWRQLVPPPVPDEQNFAKAPFVSAVFHHYRDPESLEGELSDSEIKRRTASLFSWIQELKGQGNWRQVKMTDWTAMQKSLWSRTNSQLVEIQALLAREPSSPVEDLGFLFSLNQSELNAINAAAQRPFSGFNAGYGEPLPVNLPELTAIRAISRGYHLKPRVALAGGNSESALADWQTAVRIGRTADGDPVLISFLVKLTVTDATLQTVWEGLALNYWSEAQLRIIQKTLQGINLVADAQTAFRCERALNLTWMDQVYLSAKSAGSRLTGRFLLTGWLAQNKVTIARMYEDYIFPILDPGRKHVDVALARINERKALAELQGFAPYHMLARMLQPAIVKTTWRLANAQNAIHLATVACALERHRLAHSSHPAALNALVPAYLDAIPLDLDRQPLRYQLQPDGSFILYSIGVDLKDDNGRIGKPDGKFSTEEGDWVWKYPEAADR